MRHWVGWGRVSSAHRLDEGGGRCVDDLRRVWLRRDGVADRSHLLRADCGLGASVFWESLCLDGGAGPTNLRVHLEIDHRCRYRWWGRAAVLCGQECKRRDEVWSKVIGTRIGSRRGTFVGTHVSMRTGVYVCAERLVRCTRRFRGREDTRRYLGMYGIRVC